MGRKKDKPNKKLRNAAKRYMLIKREQEVVDVLECILRGAMKEIKEYHDKSK